MQASLCKVESSTIMPETKVTLTNWVRLNNAPLLLPRASAVQWNDHVFVLASDSTALLFHAKLKLWSMLPKCPYSMNDNVPLVNYRGEIRAVSKDARICAFDVATSSWKVIPKPSEGEIISATVNHDTLYVYMYVRIKTKPTQRYPPRTPALFTTTTRGWEQQDLNDLNELGSKILLTSEHLFIESDKCIYRQKINSGSESETKSDEQQIDEQQIAFPPYKEIALPPYKEIALPPYKAFTLHVLKDMLLSFGGRDEDYQPTSDVLRYNPDTDTWESAGYMRSARYNVAVATVQQDNTTEVYVLGGEFGSTKLKMKPKLQTNTESTPTGQTPANWDCSTSIVEKCILSD